MLSLGKSLVVIVSYALTTEQPAPCGPEPYSPGKRPRTRSSLGKGPVAPCFPGVALSQNSWRPRTSCGVPDPSAEREQTPRLGGVRKRHVSAGAGTRAAVKVPLEDLPTYRIQCGWFRSALPQQSPRRLLTGCTDGRALPRCTVQPLAPLTPRASVCYAR